MVLPTWGHFLVVESQKETKIFILFEYKPYRDKYGWRAPMGRLICGLFEDLPEEHKQKKGGIVRI